MIDNETDQTTFKRKILSWPHQAKKSHVLSQNFSFTWSLYNYCKARSIFLTVIWSEFRMGQYRDDDHREDTPHFILTTQKYGIEWEKMVKVHGIWHYMRVNHTHRIDRLQTKYPSKFLLFLVHMIFLFDII